MIQLNKLQLRAEILTVVAKLQIMTDVTKVDKIIEVLEVIK